MWSLCLFREQYPNITSNPFRPPFINQPAYRYAFCVVAKDVKKDTSEFDSNHKLPQDGFIRVSPFLPFPLPILTHHVCRPQTLYVHHAISSMDGLQTPPVFLICAGFAGRGNVWIQSRGRRRSAGSTFNLRLFGGCMGRMSRWNRQNGASME